MKNDDILRERWSEETKRRKTEGEVYGDYIIIEATLPGITSTMKLLNRQADETNKSVNGKIKRIRGFASVEQGKALCGWTGVIPMEANHEKRD